MVAGVGRATVVRIGTAVATLAATATVAPRIALALSLLLSIAWVMRRDDRLGTWGVLYVLLLMILAVLTLLVGGLAFIHAAASG